MPVSSELLKKFGFDEETTELGRNNYGIIVEGPTGFPKPKGVRRAVLQEFNQSIEEMYFWLLEEIRQSQGFKDITKITDIFSASEQSAFFGSAQQRLGLQQDKVSQFLATIGKMVKELFQLVRELRILDERLGYYVDSSDATSKSRESAEITLKGIWIDLIEQGAKNPASVYGMSRELQFTTLPDLFFSINPPTNRDVDEYVDKLDFNRKVKEVLKRKLRTYLEWKERTHHELKSRRLFTLKYLRQHFDIIRMYMTWVKPYLKNIRRLQLAERQESPDLISAFEGSIVEIELLLKRFSNNMDLDKPIKHNTEIYAVIIVYIFHRTKPTMSYQQEYQKGPMHIGLTDLQMRAYAWNKKKIDKYIKMKEHEDMLLLESVDDSVKAAMEALGDELEKYLKEAGEEITMPKEKKIDLKKPQTIYDPFFAVFRGAFELFGVNSHKKEKEHSHLNEAQLEIEKDIAKKDANGTLWQLYKNFKKKNKCLNW
ncbi:hypothetical protein J4434_04890 [Candidatus Woesearchaeota archaeon]|nr:hypothetical protein [Candidatus Woesearchaeota archaeon]